jgi:hypothetical protein
MTVSVEREPAVLAAGADSRARSFLALLLWCSVPLVIAAWALLSRPVVLSREMTWDLLFNMAGAWHVFHGHMPHLDFHDPGGALPFYLTALGFHLIGPRPAAFVVGAVAMMAALSSAAFFVAWRRLPLIPATLFVLFSGFLVLMPANAGDQPNAYSFAMSYNRYGWSALGVLALLLFVPPRNARRVLAGDFLDLAIAAALLTGLWYLKVTYFAAGLLLTAYALPLSPHIRARWPAWTILGSAVVANALAPHSRPYLLDVIAAAQAGAIRDNVVIHANFFLNYGAEYAWGVAFAGAALWLCRYGNAPPRLPVTIGLLYAVGLLVLTQNSQSHAMPLGIVAAFVLYDALRQHRPEHSQEQAPVLLPVVLALPVLALMSSLASVAGYVRAAADDPDLTVVSRTNLQGLAVPMADTAMLAAFNESRVPLWTLLNRSREARPHHELLPAEYVETLLEAVDFLSRMNPGRIATIDQVNPMPFILGLDPPRGGDLWSDGAASVLPPEATLSEADLVLVPKFPTWRQGTAQSLARYESHLASDYRLLLESRSWLVFRRTREGSAPSPASLSDNT